MTRRVKDALIGVVYLVVIGALLTVSIMIYNRDFVSHVDVALQTDHVGNALQEGSDVKVRGVLVGRVGDVSTSGTGARVLLQLDPDKAAQLPSNVTGQLLPKTLFGERYVALVLPADPSPSKLRDGDVVQQDRSRGSIELEQLFSDLLPTLQALEPAKLSVVLTQLADGLRDRGSDLGTLTATIAHYTQALRPQVPRIASDLDALVKVAHTYTAAAPDLVDALDSLTVTSRTLVAQRTQFTALLRSLTSTGNTIGGFVSTNSQAIIGLSRDSVPSLQVLARYAPEFPCLTSALVQYIPVADRAFGAGTASPGARVTLHVVPPSAPYRSSDRPVSSSTDPGPRCPYSTSTAAALANSTSESALVNELVGASSGTDPAALPDWSSLLLGPALRQTQVTLK